MEMLRIFIPQLMTLAGYTILLIHMDDLEPIVQNGILIVILAEFFRKDGTLEYFVKKIKLRKHTPSNG